jgi:SAM-dependent methyltransferase
MVAAAAGRPILDVACGGGRNAVLVAFLGGNVICIDKDLSRLTAQLIALQATGLARACSRITPLALDLICDEWPFLPQSAGGILNVHFLHGNLFPVFARSIAQGGYLLLETVQNRGENYRQLPRAGTLRSAFESSFALDVYKERRCGPDGHDAVTVQLFGRRR